MCLAIPGRVMEYVDEENRLARVDVAGVRRTVNVGLLDAEGTSVQPGDWVLGVLHDRRGHEAVRGALE